MLVVGAGTGEEVLALATALSEPGFVAVEPAVAMANICEARLSERGCSDRVQIHRGLLSRLPASEPFSAATAVPVSQHLPGREGARGFFAETRSRLLPGAILFSADAHIPAGVDRKWLMEMWCTQITCNGISRDQAELMRAGIEQGITIRDEDDLVEQIRAAGFVDVNKLFSSLIYGAWTSRNP